MKDQLFNRKILFSLLAVVMCLGFTAMSYGAPRCLCGSCYN